MQEMHKSRGKLVIVDSLYCQAGYLAIIKLLTESLPDQTSACRIRNILGRKVHITLFGRRAQVDVICSCPAMMD